MRTIYSTDEIAARMPALAREIMAVTGPNFTMVPILTGGFIFAADLARALHVEGADPEIDFIQLASYGAARQSSGEVRMAKDVSADPAGRTILLVDDVLDTGRSIEFATRHFLERGAAAVHVCVAVDKTGGARTTDLQADFRLFSMAENAFLVGYGMDDAGGQRGLPTISALQD